MSRLLAIGDIHGCARALGALLAAAQPKAEDTVVTLGDYVDRGPDSYGVLERLIALSKQCRLVALRGNHEMMMLAAREDDGHESEWLRCGGNATLASYSHLGDAGKLVDVPDHHWEFLENTCRDWHETAQHLFVHANAYPDFPLSEQPPYMLFWEQVNAAQIAHSSGKTLVCGHTPQKSGRPLHLGHTICIDTWAHGRGWLTCVELKSGKVWQANQAGEQQTAYLDDFALE